MKTKPQNNDLGGLTPLTYYDYNYKHSNDLQESFADAKRDAIARLVATAKTFAKWGLN